MRKIDFAGKFAGLDKVVGGLGSYKRRLPVDWSTMIVYGLLCVGPKLN